MLAMRHTKTGARATSLLGSLLWILTCLLGCDALFPVEQVGGRHGRGGTLPGADGGVPAPAAPNPCQQNGVICSGHGTCSVDPDGRKARCLCDDGYVEQGLLCLPQGSPGPAPWVPPPGDCPLTSHDYTQKGLYTVATTPAGGAHTVYYPREMDGVCKHPIVAWGNGTGVTGPGVYASLLNHLASHGFVVIAAHTSMAGSGQAHRIGLDWLIKHSSSKGSVFQGKLATSSAGTTGHSQGGIGAAAATSHPSVRAMVSVQGGGSSGKPSLFLTGTADMFSAMTQGGYGAATGPAFFASYQGADHIGTPTVMGANSPAQAQYRRLMVGWFRCFLVNDQKACSLFRGHPNCGICNDAGWAKLDAKNL